MTVTHRINRRSNLRKTGSVQVVNLKKNRNQTDVSILWKEHAMFASFAPSEDPEIVVAVISEHDDKGGGGASAAPVAGGNLNWISLAATPNKVASLQELPFQAPPTKVKMNAFECIKTTTNNSALIRW